MSEEDKLLDEAIMTALAPILGPLGVTFVTLAFMRVDNYCHGMQMTTSLVSDKMSFEAKNEVFIELLKGHLKKLEGKNE